MEWTKIPTNLLNGKFEDKEILAIVKYQLLYALYEEEPNDKILNRFLTKRQQLALNRYVVDIKLNVENEINRVQKKRTSNNLKYAENKEKYKNSDVLSDDLSDGCQTEQIRLDKIREDIKTTTNNSVVFDFFEKSIQDCFQIYKDSCTNLIPLSFERKNREILGLVATTFKELDYDVGKFTELCIKANRLETIAEKKIDFKMMLRNYIGILNDKYKKPEEKNILERLGRV